VKRLVDLTLCLLTILLATNSALIAQEMRTVTGTVTARVTQQPFGGVRVSVKGTLIATVTDTRGNYSLRVPADAAALVFTYLGYKAEEVSIADQVEPAFRVDVRMEQVAIGIEGVVVTALGFEREKKTLGYSVQDIQGEELVQVPKYNIVNALQGTVAGVNITDAGPTGGSARVVIRGASSISGNNQPLFVVDGIPIDNSSSRNSGYGGIDYGNAASDIAPENIENISVLKGPAAAALYGSRAANGAVVITTKSGRATASSGLGMTVDISLTAEQPLKLPDYQDLYGQGLFGEFNWVDGQGGGLWDFVDESWGPRLCPTEEGCTTLIDQFTGPQQPWVAHPDNVRSFFRTGTTLNTNVAIARASERAHVRLSLGRSGLRGMSPGNTQERISVALKGGAGITDRLSTEASLNYIDQNAENRPGTGYDEDNPMQSYIWFGRQVDMDALRNYECWEDAPTPCQEGGQYNWNYNYHNNPFWEALVNTNNDERDRLIGHLSVDYQVNDWITATARIGKDWYRDHRKRVIAPYSLDDAGEGSFGEETMYRSETNLDVFANANRQLASDFTMALTLGGNLRTNNYEGSGVSVSRLTAPGIYSIDNAKVTPSPWDQVSKREVRSLYGSVSLNYAGWLNLDLTGRNDWSSTLPEDNRSYFYPSVSGAFVFSDALGLPGGLFSSGKVRAGWTRVGNDADPYQLAPVFSSSQPWGSSPMFSVPNQLPNATLKPEETTAWELGTDLGFFDERLGFVLTYYNHETINQILGVEISRASGFSSEILNAGAVRNRGWELLLRANPIRSSNFNWDLTVNWSKNMSEVTELYGDLETLVLGTYWSLNIEARAGEPYGVMFGNGYLRCPNDDYADICAGKEAGLLILNADGERQVDPERRILGNYNPDWIGGIQNRFTFGRFDLSILVDGQRGGDIFSVTNWFGEYAGVLESTIEGRENDWDDPGVLVPGVLPDGTVNGENGVDVRVDAQTHWGQNWGSQEASIDDATFIKLREVRLGVELPGEWVEWSGFSAAHFALIGRNLLLWTPNIDNIDPETAFDASNVQGIEFGQFPTARSFGFALSLR
jgi:TonB-linked SusC/RagA family outer membrane protein